MHTKLAALSVLAVATIVLSGVASAGPAASKQRIAITTAKGNGFSFVLTPLTSGRVTRDPGSASACPWTQRFVTRDGQESEIDNPLKPYAGKQGTFTMRLVINWINAGNAHTTGTAPWRNTAGRGAYKHLEGKGRVTVSWPGARSSWQSSRAEGIVELNR